MIRKALISVDNAYRYSLGRRWANGEELLWVMLNPSTADATAEDATTRRCISFSNRWGFGAIVIVNLFGFISTDPKRLTLVLDPVGPENDSVLFDHLRRSENCMVAWGSLVGNHLFQSRMKEIYRHLPNNTRCLGLTKYNYPRHPLRVSSVTKPMTYVM